MSSFHMFRTLLIDVQKPSSNNALASDLLASPLPMSSSVSTLAPDKGNRYKVSDSDFSGSSSDSKNKVAPEIYRVGVTAHTPNLIIYKKDFSMGL